MSNSQASGGSGDSGSGYRTPQQNLQQQQQQQQQASLLGPMTTASTAATITASMAESQHQQQQQQHQQHMSNMAADSSPRESGDDSEDESEVLDESPCGRWQKRPEEVDQRDVPGIACVHLAMDTEEGVEVVWNEVQYSSMQEFKSQEDKMRMFFDNILQLDHQNIVKFHKYWSDTQDAARPRFIFITEYMSSGSLKQFLKRTKRNAKRLPLEAWRRWCTQILSALSYLHSCTPPVVHGNLTCDSIFIQHNGLVKIGSVVHNSAQQQREQQSAELSESPQHFMAPEYSAEEQLPAVDIYAFGMCALEMAALEIQPISSSDAGAADINEDTILRTIDSLEHDLQRDLISKCLRRNPLERPNANDLLFHPLLFEVHSLKLLAAHCLVFSPKNQTMYSETLIDAIMQRYNRPEVIMAKIIAGGEETNYSLTNVPSADKLEKFVEDVKYGVYPLTALGGKKPPHFRSRAASPERTDTVKSATPEPVDIESRRIVNMVCTVKKMKEDSDEIAMTILLRMDDKMNRQLTCQVTEMDNADDLTAELVRLGFVHVEDQDILKGLLEKTLKDSFADGGAAFEYNEQPLTFSATINEQNPLGRNISSSIAAGASASAVAAASVMAPMNVAGRNVAAMVSNVAGMSMMPQTNAAAANAAMNRNWAVADMELQQQLQLQQQQQQQAVQQTQLQAQYAQQQQQQQSLHQQQQPPQIMMSSPQTAAVQYNNNLLYSAQLQQQQQQPPPTHQQQLPQQQQPQQQQQQQLQMPSPQHLPSPQTQQYQTQAQTQPQLTQQLPQQVYQQQILQQPQHQQPQQQQAQPVYQQIPQIYTQNPQTQMLPQQQQQTMLMQHQLPAHAQQQMLQQQMLQQQQPQQVYQQIPQMYTQNPQTQMLQQQQPMQQQQPHTQMHMAQQQSAAPQQQQQSHLQQQPQSHQMPSNLMAMDANAATITSPLANLVQPVAATAASTAHTNTTASYTNTAAASAPIN